MLCCKIKFFQLERKGLDFKFVKMAVLRLAFCTLLMIPALVFSQRENQELPLFESIPYFEMRDSIVGWSLSSDGQWLSAPKTVPAIGISRNKSFYEQRDNMLGVDNIQSMIAYKVKFGKDTMICLIKTMTSGYFKYPNRRAGWREQTDMYYWLFKHEDLKNALDYFSANDTGQTFVLRIRSFDSKGIPDVDEDEMLDLIKANLLVKPNFDRNFVLTIRKGENRDIIQFHLLSLHAVFTDVEGVLTNFKVKGRTIYGSTRLFDFMYFEADYLNFWEILNLNANRAALEELGGGFELAPDLEDPNFANDDWDEPLDSASYDDDDAWLYDDD